MCKYTGHYKAKITKIVEKNGGELHFDVTYMQRKTIVSGFFFLDGYELRLNCEDSLFPNVTQMYITLHECGYGVANSDGALGSGNAATCISGKFRMYDNIVTELKMKTLFELTNGIRAN
jgi:hypothetical protein